MAKAKPNTDLPPLAKAELDRIFKTRELLEDEPGTPEDDGAIHGLFGSSFG